MKKNKEALLAFISCLVLASCGWGKPNLAGTTWSSRCQNDAGRSSKVISQFTETEFSVEVSSYSTSNCPEAALTEKEISSGSYSILGEAKVSDAYELDLTEKVFTAVPWTNETAESFNSTAGLKASCTYLKLYHGLCHKNSGIHFPL